MFDVAPYTTAPVMHPDEISVEAETMENCGTGRPLSKAIIHGRSKKRPGGPVECPPRVFAKRVTMPSTMVDLSGVRALMTKVGQLLLRCPIVDAARSEVNSA